MDAIFANFFLDIQSRIQTVPAAKWIDQDLGQLEDYKDGYRPAVAWHCVLIDFDEWQWEDLPDGSQQGTGFVLIRIAFPPFSNTNHVTPLPQKEKALEYYELETQVNAVLHGWASGPFTRLLRRASALEKRNDPLRVRVIRYETSVIDATARPERRKIPRPNPVVGSDLTP